MEVEPHFMQQHTARPLKPGEEYPWFGRVHIETTSWCNRVCPFCPISHGRRDFFTSMEDSTYSLIMQCLHDIEFKGFLALFLLNEPLLDKRLHERAQTARLACPKSTIYISTNADVWAGGFPVDAVAAVYESGVNSVNLNVYDTGQAGEDRLAWTEEFAAKICRAGIAQRHGNKYAKVSPARNWLAVTDMRPDRPKAVQFYDTITARSTEDRAQVAEAPKAYCPRPARDLVVRYDGAVLMCCALDPSDPEEGTIAGYIGKESLTDIWNGDVMRKYRWMLQQKRRELPGCRTCTQRVAYPWAFRRIEPTEDERTRWEAAAKR